MPEIWNLITTNQILWHNGAPPLTWISQNFNGIKKGAHSCKDFNFWIMSSNRSKDYLVIVTEQSIQLFKLQWLKFFPIIFYGGQIACKLQDDPSPKINKHIIKIKIVKFSLEAEKFAIKTVKKKWLKPIRVNR